MNLFEYCYSCGLKGKLNSFWDCSICGKTYCPHCCYIGKSFILELGHCEYHDEFLKKMKINNWDKWCEENEIDLNDQQILHEIKNDWDKFQKKWIIQNN